MHYFTSLLFNNSAQQYPRPPLDIQLIGERVLLRIGDPQDWHSWHDVRESSRAFLTPWEPLWPRNALSYDHFCGQLRRHWREWRSGIGYSFQITLLPKEGHAHLTPHELLTLPIVGGIALNDITRGIAQRGTLGYWMGQAYTQQGLMTEAAELATSFAFDSLRLHRLEAACLPTNIPSQNLLDKLGFDHEGRAKDFLRINGRWEDHLLWGKINPADMPR